LEAEAMLLGIWKNIEDLEDSLNLQELNAILSASREQEYRSNKFAAALKGVDLDKHSAKENQERFDEIERRAHAKLHAMRTGANVEQTERRIELADLGFDLEIEE
jgi:hypothetical protein